MRYSTLHLDVLHLMELHEDDTLTKVNAELPPAIRLQGIKRVTKNFNSKASCDARTYLYLMPTFAVCPLEQIVTEQYRIDEKTRSQVNKILGLFVGSHYYHNYTAGKLPMEPSSLRFITEFEAGEPFEENGLEFVVIKVKGQSFMLHQIRKMIGMMIAVMRGYTTEATIEATWGKDRIDIPRAPGLGLMLNEVHYERYNKRFGSDGIHEALTWDDLEDELESFKKDVIFADIIQTEKEERSMLDWMSNLPIHSFEPRHFESVGSPTTPLKQARSLLGNLKDKDAEEDEKLPKGLDVNDEDDDERVVAKPLADENCEVADVKA